MSTYKYVFEDLFSFQSTAINLQKSVWCELAKTVHEYTLDLRESKFQILGFVLRED